MYEVQAIVGKRVNTQTNTLQYQVKWFNYPNESNTWEPEKNLKFVKNLIEEFNNRTQIKGDLGLVMKNTLRTIKQEEVVKSEQKNKIFDFNEARAGIFLEDESSKENNSASQLHEQCPNEDQTPSRKTGRSIDAVKTQALDDRILSIEQEKQGEDNPSRMGLAHLQAKGVDRNNSKGEKNQLSKKTPPLPPDFAINKSRYINPELLKTKQVGSCFYPKRKFIEKDRNQEANLKRKEYEYRPVISQSKMPCAQLIPDGIHLRGSTYLASKKKATPAPTHYISQPILQQNYLSNQYHVNSNRPPDIYNPSMKPVGGCSGSKQPSSACDPYGESIESGHWNYKYQNNWKMSEKNQKKPEEKSFKVFGVRSMEKTESGYIYLSETSQGTVWLSRDQLVPSFSVLLLQFYERHLRFD